MKPEAGPGKSQREPGRLFVVATPIGNLQDLSPRAHQILEQVEWIACEDTRHSAKLLSHFGVRTPTLSYHDFNEEQRSRELLQRLLRGENGALISDAGTPLVSDPGFHLVRLCRQRGVNVTAVPGPSAAVAALSISGLPTSRFLFAGFPPRKESDARRFFEALKSVSDTLTIYLAPHRLARNLGLCLEAFGPREAFLVRELTKLYEESWWGSLADLVKHASQGPAKGEYTLVVAGSSDPDGDTPDLDAAAYVAGLQQLRGVSRKEALRTACRQLKIPRNRLYRLLLEEGGND